MRADFSRDTFHPLKQFQRVLLQQGRVLLDADWNEQASILLHQTRLLAKTLIGDAGGRGASFQLVLASKDPVGLSDFFQKLLITEGTYWVQGYACENGAGATFASQPFAVLPDDQAKTLRDQLTKVSFAYAYLAVWERHVTYLQDPSLREVALGMNGPDTATRTQLVWQVRLLVPDPGTGRPDGEAAFKKDAIARIDKMNADEPSATAQLKAIAKKADSGDEAPCSISPASQYRGPENQLYRVEIHQGGTLGKDAKNPVTFKWSRENGSVSFPVAQKPSDRITLGTLGRDQRFGLKQGDWVEYSDDNTSPFDPPAPLMKVTGVFPDDRAISVDPALKVPAFSTSLHPVLTRWEGTAPVTEATGPDDLPRLEAGIQIQFRSDNQIYRQGEAWLIPGRVETGDIEGPHDFVRGRFNKQHFTPLQILIGDAANNWTVDPHGDLRTIIGG